MDLKHLNPFNDPTFQKLNKRKGFLKKHVNKSIVWFPVEKLQDLIVFSVSSNLHYSVRMGERKGTDLETEWKILYPNSTLTARNLKSRFTVHERFVFTSDL